VHLSRLGYVCMREKAREKVMGGRGER
jgi:hypothetical protein